MKVDTTIDSDLNVAGEQAHHAEDQGYDGVWTPEIAHNPFFPLLFGAQRTKRVSLGTGIAVAFARSPMNMAAAAWDIQSFSEGRFLLGLGSQIKLHIEKRYSMPWSSPAARMREFICAMEAIWDCWQNDTPLDFQGDFYSHTIMTPFFDPGPIPAGRPKVFLAAVGEGMTKVASEVADGMLVHGFTTERYLREVTTPIIEAGLTAGGRARSEFELSYPALVVTGNTEEEMAAALVGTRKQIAFYGSTPAYRAILELHGWGELQPELNAASKLGEWDEMGKLITDEILNTFAVVGTPEEIPVLLQKRFGDIIDRISIYQPYEDVASDIAPRVLAGLHEAAAG